jgi:diguanylate cyclase (GGDEF)-like protein
LNHQAAHDALTNLINRSEFERIMRSALENMHKQDVYSLLYLDLDQFKVINDTCGHIAGDVLLQQIATILLKTVRETDVVARLGGDEFAVLLPYCNIEAAVEIGEKLLGAVNKYVFTWDERQFRVSMSIGAVEIESGIQNYDSLMRAADLSCYAAKDYGRNRLHIYREQDRDLIRRHSEMQWVEKLQHGLEQNRFVLYGQYIRTLGTKGEPQHLEILIRYLDRSGNIITPCAFLPAAERYNLAPSIDQWVLKNVFADNKLISLLRLDPGLRVNINLSGLTLSDPSTTRFITNLIQERQLPPKSLCFEITETAAVVDLTATSQFIRSMRLLGCEFALDDFGIGVSSFAYLRNLPVDYLKIDGSFVRDLDKNPVNAAMVSAINHIGHVLKIRTVAEFVENETIMRKLQGIGVDYAQGFYVHSPCPLEEIYNVLHMPNGKSLS